MKSPAVTITERALQAFRDAEPEAGEGNVLRLVIDSKFHADLYFAPIEPDELVIVVDGLRLAMNALTARRADGLRIDYVETPSATGFKLDNPNASNAVHGVCPADVVQMLERREAFQFIDIRTEAEWDKARVTAARRLDPLYQAELESLPRETKLLFLGHHGSDGQAAARPFHQRGFEDVWYVVGGIDAWSTIDPKVPRY